MMDTKYYITIGRQLGSGGHSIGKKLAGKLEISFYDKEIIYLASEKSGLCKEFFEKADETSSHSLVGGFFGLRNSLIDGIYSNGFLTNEKLFSIQSDTIREIAEKESAVFVGRCADYVLGKKPNCFNIFVYADQKDRVKRILERNAIPEETARELIIKTDRKRAGYYNYFSGKSWGSIDSYHLCINTSAIDEDEAVGYLLAIIKNKFQQE
jgi:cytidylate kinase